MLSLAASAYAQPKYPSAPIKLVVTNAPGSANDTTTRFIAERLTALMSTSVVVENKPGANGVLASDYVAKQPADGHTLLMTGSTHFINQSLYKDLPFDSVNDFTQVAKAVDAYLVLVVPANSPFDTLRQLVNYTAANPDKLSYASSGNGSTPHMAGALLMKVANVNAVHVPYKRGDQAIADTVGGQFAMTFSAIPPVITLIKGGNSRRWP